MNEATRCLYCGSVEQLSVEHLIPGTRGGRHISENIFRACRGCNTSKGDRLPSEWREDLSAAVYEFERRSLALHPEVVVRAKRDEIRIQTAIRLTESFMNRLDKFAVHMSRPGLRVTRTEVLRIAAIRGLEQLEEERRKKT